MPVPRPRPATGRGGAGGRAGGGSRALPLPPPTLVVERGAVHAGRMALDAPAPLVPATAAHRIGVLLVLGLELAGDLELARDLELAGETRVEAERLPKPPGRLERQGQRLQMRASTSHVAVRQRQGVAVSLRRRPSKHEPSEVQAGTTD